MDEVDVVVVGAGVVGLAVARALAQAGREVIILEAAEAIGTGISSRNSEVIHAGIYYPKDSLMARFCVAGRHALYAFCADHGVPHRRCGKLIVATNEAEAGKLASIEARARANGVDDMRLLSAGEAQALEPALACTGALLSPSTGIVDSHRRRGAARERREYQRTLCLMPTRLFGYGLSGGVPARICDISPGGARVAVEATDTIPDAVQLQSPLCSRRRLAEVRWRQPTAVGIKFL